MRLTHVRLLVSDFSACYRFYRDAPGLETRHEDNGAYAEFRVNDSTMLALFPRAEMAAAVGTASLAAAAEAQDRVALVLDAGDVDAFVASLRERGVEPAVGPVDHREWGLRTAHVRDPDGNLVELFHDIEWEHE